MLMFCILRFLFRILFFCVFDVYMWSPHRTRRVVHSSYIFNFVSTSVSYILSPPFPMVLLLYLSCSILMHNIKWLLFDSQQWLLHPKTMSEHWHNNKLQLIQSTSVVSPLVSVFLPHVAPLGPSPPSKTSRLSFSHCLIMLTYGCVDV